MRILNPVLSTLLVVGLGACATGGMSAGDSVTRLEQQQRADPKSAAVNRSLGIAYYKAARHVVKAVVGLRQLGKFACCARAFPIKRTAIDHHAANDCAVTAQKLGGRVVDQVSAVV